MTDEVIESGGDERPSVSAYRRWTSTVVEMVAAIRPDGDGYRVGPLEVGANSRHALVAPLDIDPGDISARLDAVAAMVRNVHATARVAADTTEAVIRELGLAPDPPGTERVAMLRSLASDLEQAASQHSWWHPATVGLVLRVRQDMREGDPRIPVKITVYI